MFYRVVKVELRQVQQHCELFASWNIHSIHSGKFDESRLESGACDNVFFKIRIFSNAPPDCQTEPDTSFPTCGQFHYELKKSFDECNVLISIISETSFAPDGPPSASYSSKEGCQCQRT